MQSNYAIAQQIANKMRHVPGTADVHVQQLLSLPTLHMDIERTRVTQVGLTARDVAQSALVSLSGSFQTSPNFWLNPKNEVTYQMAVQAPQYRMTDLQDLMNIPVISQQGSAIDGKPGAIHADSARRNGEPLQCAAGDRRICQHAGSGFGSRRRRYRQNPEDLRRRTCREARTSSFADRFRRCGRRSSGWAWAWWEPSCWSTC